MAAPSSSPVYLVELSDPHLGVHQSTDITRFLENAVATVLKHLEPFAEPVSAEVQVDPGSGDLAGIVFFTEEEDPIAVIRPYYLDRETVECTNAEIFKATSGPLNKLEKQLNRIFER